MKELSIFVDESGDFGTFEGHSAYYIISMVIHSQEKEIKTDIEWLEKRFTEIGYPAHCLHAAPIIRNEDVYRKDSLDNRRKLLSSFMTFFRKIDVKCKTFSIEMRHIGDSIEATGKLSRLLSRYIRDNYSFFQSFDVVKIYYDNGQIEVSRLLSSVFNALLENVEFRKVLPSDYRLFQAADFVATLKLLEIKLERNELSRSEEAFFETRKKLVKNYLRVLEGKSSLGSMEPHTT